MILYFDTETTGLAPGNICQLSYVLQDKDGLKAKNFFFTVDSVEYSAYLVHGFSVEKLRMLSGGRRFIDDAEEIVEDFASANVIAAHNASFDLAFMRAECERAGVKLTYRAVFDSMKSTVGVCKLPRASGGYKYPKLRELCAFFGITEEEVLTVSEKLFEGDFSNYHDARFDTVAMVLAVNACMKRYDGFWDLEDKL